MEAGHIAALIDLGVERRQSRDYAVFGTVSGDLRPTRRNHHEPGHALFRTSPALRASGWVNNTVTPFERPQELADKEFLSDDELAVIKERAARLFAGSGDIAQGDALFLTLLRNPESSLRPTGDYNQF